MACVAEFPLHMAEGRPRKRRKLTSLWDVLPFNSQAQQTLVFSGQGVLAHKTASPPWRDDDKDGHYMFELGDNLTPRYKILSKMGEGTFGQVLECWDRQAREFVAVKIVRGLQKYREAAMIEVDVLNEVGRNDKKGTRCVQMRNWFDYRNHICIVLPLNLAKERLYVNSRVNECKCFQQVFEKLGPSLYDFLRKNNYFPFPIDLVREIGRQLLESVAYMHELHLIHTDLKPENVLFVSSEYVKLSLQDKEGMRLPKSSAIKLIDFGSTTFENQNHSSVVSTRHYRAPEVILGLGWSYPCDIWSVGCILVELCTGETLFQTHENLEHLAMMERVFGPLPQHMIKNVDRKSMKYFRHGSKLDWPEGAASRESIRAVRRLLQFKNLILSHVDHSAGAFIDLLQGLLRYEPSQRFEAHEALNHPFFREASRRF